MTGFSEKA